MKVKQTVRLIGWCWVLVMLLSITTALNAANSEPENPEQVIHQLQLSLLQVMREGEQLGYEGRFKF
ncbi:MAG: hypothetical protein AAB073_02575, partial [Pseudomonadota bacterium]